MVGDDGNSGSGCRARCPGRGPSPHPLPVTAGLGQAGEVGRMGGKVGGKPEAACDTHPTGTQGHLWERGPRHPPGFCHSPSCPPNLHQIPSVGRIQCHVLQAPCEPRGEEEKQGSQVPG